MKQIDLLNEVESIIDEQMAANGTVAIAWVVQAMLDRHSDISGSDAEIHRLCAGSHFRFTAREVLRGRKKAEEENEPRQSDLFPGYRHLQRHYIVDRGGEAEVVRLEEMTSDEINEKAMALRSFAHGAITHADELADYLKARESRSISNAG